MKDIGQSGESWQGDGDGPKEHRDAFPCRGCGKTVTLAHRIDGTAYTIKSLLRSSIRPVSPGA